MKVLLFANTDWYLYNFRLPLARGLQRDGHQVILLSPPGPYATLLQEAGFAWQEISLSQRGINPVREALVLLRLVRLYRREKPDLVHHFTIKCVLYGSLAAKLTGIRFVINAVTGLGYVFSESRDQPKWLRAWVKFLYKLALRGTHVIFQNPDDRGAFVEAGLTTQKDTALIRSSGVDIDHFSPQPERDGVPLVILPARMFWEKGVGEFVNAARLLKEKGCQARFALVGDTDPGNRSSVPAEQIEAWEEEQVVEWWGWKENMPEVYGEAHLVCLPSYREGVPKTLIEAAACGRPIVATDVPGCKEIVRHGENGLLVPPQDPLALSSALEELILSPSLRQQMGERGRTIAVNEFSISKVVSETLEVYKALL